LGQGKLGLLKVPFVCPWLSIKDSVLYKEVNSLNNKTLLIIGGTGNIGSKIFQATIESRIFSRIVITGFKKNIGESLVSNALFATYSKNSFPDIQFLKLDMNNNDHLKVILKRLKPRVIIQAAVPISPKIILQAAKKKLKEQGLSEAGITSGLYAHILPICLIFTVNLLKELKKLALNTIVFNLPYPDTANAVLAKADLGNPISAGTIDLTAFGICKAISELYNVPLKELQVKHVSHHALRVNLPGKVPFFLKAYRKGIPFDISGTEEQIILKAIKITSEHDISWMVGESTAKHVKAILSPNTIYSHMPGFRDVPGGIPIIIGNGEVRQNLPEGLTMNEVIEINNKGMYIDGVESIEDNGIVKFNKYTARYLKDVLGLNWESFNLEQINHICKDILAAYY